MQLGMIGLGRMGASMVRRLMRAGHTCVVYDRNADAVEALTAEGARGAADLAGFVAALAPPRAVWVMVPAAVVDRVIDELETQLEPGDIIIDGGNSWYKDDIERAARLADKGLQYLDVGTSGGVWGLERGYCLMIGGDASTVQGLEPVFATLAPGPGDIPRTAGRAGEPSPSEQGWLHCGPAGAGHFVKMVHNGIEYGLMAAYAEGMNLLRHANVGSQGREEDAETTPLRDPRAFSYDIDVAEVAELWRRGSVVTSWLLDLTAAALHDSPGLEDYSGRVSDSGEGRWTSIAAIESGVPARVLTTALYDRFSSRGESDFADRVLSAMRYGFGGHLEKK
ncbi:MAG: decarboxylating 6-phosphogluconate dehydrogenase [Thiohalobacterales bacterium]|nr:decarboxylating 6-phosphogluconate dehydrogenase [Thiohalobacterales bacterium]